MSMNHSFKFGVSSCYKFGKWIDVLAKFEIDICVRITRRDLTLILSMGLHIPLICMRAEHIEYVG